MKEDFLKYKIDNMTTKEKIGQMIMFDYRNVLEMNNDLENIMTKYTPGGFILFKSNIANFNQTQRFLSDIKSVGSIKTMIAVDEEGGKVQRLDERVNFPKYPSMALIGQTENEMLAFNIGKNMGNNLKSIGIDMNMAPVLDIFSNPKNNVVSNRAFGKNSDTVKKMAFSFADGLMEENIIPVGKHFPGHGDTTTDSHIDLPIINKDLNDLKSLELIPFVEAVRKNLPGIMVAHIAVPKITFDNTPSSLSKKMIYDLLRKDIGYNGLIITDSLKMKALSNYYSNEQIYLKCIKAGNDIMLMPKDIKKACNIIYENIDNGNITIERINESVYRILNVKFDYGFFSKEYEEYTNNHKLIRKKHK